MIRRKNISTYTLALAVSLFLLMPGKGWAQYGRKKLPEKIIPDTTAFLNGFAISADLLGPVMLAFNDYGSAEAALRVNLKDYWFPTIEIGLGKADNVDAATQTSYKTKAPFFRIGCDYNLLKDKHDIYRLFGGLRYGFTSYKFDIGNPGLTDPVWGDAVPFEAHDVKAHYHWLEICFGVDASVWGPLHLGWSVRYKNRLFHDDGVLGKSWYVPGFGKTGKSAFGGTFNITFDI